MQEIPELFGHAIALILGLTVGSFLNVVIIRIPSGKSIVKPASHCPKCATPLRWFHNIPVLSYVALRGRCSKCRESISIRYPLVEVLTGLLFLAAQFKYGLSPLLLLRGWPFVALLIAITFIDLEHRIIPDRLSLPGIGLGIATSFFSGMSGVLSSLEGAALGFGLFYSLAWLYQKRSGKSGLGGGDIKLLAMLGAFLGPGGVFSTILISSVLGSLVGVTWALYEKRRTQQSMMQFAIPYGPFLVLGGLYYYLLGDLLWLPFTIPT